MGVAVCGVATFANMWVELDTAHGSQQCCSEYLVLTAFHGIWLLDYDIAYPDWLPLV